MIEEIEQVAVRSRAPILLMGPTGAGKSQLARKIYELKKLRHQIAGPFVEVNCATLKGDSAMSALFGHRKGAFTGAAQDRPGLLRSADKGLLFLDEIGDLAASVTRMATLSPTGRIDSDAVAFETGRLCSLWSGGDARGDALDDLLSVDQLTRVDPFDRVQLAYVIDICRQNSSLSAAGRVLFSASRAERRSTNDADRLRKYLARFDLDWGAVTTR